MFLCRKPIDAPCKITLTISKAKHVFEKGYTLNWSTEIFTILRLAETNPVTYHLEDYKGEAIVEDFYEQDLA